MHGSFVSVLSSEQTSDWVTQC